MNLPRGIIINIRVGEFGEDYINTALSLAEAIDRLGLIARVEAVSTQHLRRRDLERGRLRRLRGRTSTTHQRKLSVVRYPPFGGPWNTTGYSTEELDALIESQAVELDPLVRRELVLEIQREIFRGAHLFRPAASVSHWLWWTHLRNVAPSTYRADSTWLSRLWLADRVRGG